MVSVKSVFFAYKLTGEEEEKEEEEEECIIYCRENTK